MPSSSRADLSRSERRHCGYAASVCLIVAFRSAKGRFVVPDPPLKDALIVEGRPFAERKATLRLRRFGGNPTSSLYSSGNRRYTRCRPLTRRNIMNRRTWIQSLGLSAGAAGLGALAFSRTAAAPADEKDPAKEKREAPLVRPDS